MELAQLLYHSHRRPGALLNSAVNEAAPANRPVRVRKEHVSMPTPEFVQGFGQKLRRREEPCALGKFILAPVVKDLQGWKLAISF